MHVIVNDYLDPVIFNQNSNMYVYVCMYVCMYVSSCYY